MARKPLVIPFDQLVQAAEQAAREGKLGVARGLVDDALKRAPRAPRLYELGCQIAIADGDIGRAVAEASRWVTVASADPTGARALTTLADTYEIDDYSGIDRRGLRLAYQLPIVSHRGLARITLEMLVAGDPMLSDTLAGPVAAIERTGREMASTRRLPGALSSDLVAPALAAVALGDHRLERLLTGFRAGLLLDAGAAGLTDPDRFGLALALVAQMWANDHAFAETEEERARHAALTFDPRTACTGDVAAGRTLLLHLLYRPIADLPGPRLTPGEARQVRPKALGHLLADRLAADAIEAELCSKLPRLGDVGDPTSIAVRSQYEAAPYPRWTSLALPPSGFLQRTLSALSTAIGRAQPAVPFDALIAGAGTGQQVLRSAVGYGAGVSVTAIDLSAPSLAYGARKAQELGIGGIDWHVGDLMDAANLGRTFQVIECIGVLHHMADPFGGWRRLLGVLAPGGLMYVGLYSRTARRPVEVARLDPASPGAGCSDAEARAWRRVLLDRPADAPTASLATSRNFNALAEFRDLVLHTSERHFDLAEIAAFIEAERLSFAGFTLPPDVMHAFATRFPDHPAPGRLEDWATFEADNPTTFEGMYCFWVAKG